MMLAGAKALGDQSPALRDPAASLLPSVRTIREVALKVTYGVSNTRGMTDAELIKNISDADILLPSNRPLSRVVIEACPKLKLICVAFTGIDHVDEAACKARGFILHNAAGYAVHAVSELAAGLMIALLRQIVSADAVVRSRGSNLNLVGNELFGKTLRPCHNRFLRWVAHAIEI